jgi:hypothetical protein
MQVIKFGETITGQFVGIDPDDTYGTRLNLRMTAGTEKRPQGLVQQIDYYPFDPKTGKATLPARLRAGMTVRCTVDVRGKGYRSADRGVSGMVTRQLIEMEILEGQGDETMAALEDLNGMVGSVDAK